MCYGFYDWEYKYECTATDTASGKSADGGDHYSSSSGAYEHATYNLFNILDMTNVDSWDCNCGIIDSNLTDTCSLRVGVCFYFPDPGSVSTGVVNYKAYAYDRINPSYEGQSGDGFTNSTDAGTAAVTDLFSTYPVEAKACGYGPGSGSLGSALAPLVTDLEEKAAGPPRPMRLD